MPNPLISVEEILASIAHGGYSHHEACKMNKALYDLATRLGKVKAASENGDAMADLEVGEKYKLINLGKKSLNGLRVRLIEKKRTRVLVSACNDDSHRLRVPARCLVPM